MRDFSVFLKGNLEENKVQTLQVVGCSFFVHSKASPAICAHRDRQMGPLMFAFIPSIPKVSQCMGPFFLGYYINFMLSTERVICLRCLSQDGATITTLSNLVVYIHVRRRLLQVF